MKIVDCPRCDGGRKKYDVTGHCSQCAGTNRVSVERSSEKTIPVIDLPAGMVIPEINSPVSYPLQNGFRAVEPRIYQAMRRVIQEARVSVLDSSTRRLAKSLEDLDAEFDSLGGERP
jgi:hypothetical protein